MLRRLFAQKWTVVILSVLAIVGMILLSAGLHNVEFEPGYSLPFNEAQHVETTFDTAAHGFQEVPIWKQILFWTLFGVMAVLAFSMLTLALRKRLLRFIISVISTALVLLYLFNEGIISIPDIEIMGELGAMAPTPEGVGDAVSIEPFVVPQVSPWTSFFVALGIILTFLAIAWFLIRLWKRLSASKTIRTKSLDELTSIARASLDDLATGGDWDDVIIGCYARMSDAVRSGRGLSRKHAMTPTEFARRLERAGLPSDPVRRLTRLFEMVRYGGRTSSQNEINEAVSCLTDILRYCGDIS